MSRRFLDSVVAMTCLTTAIVAAVSFVAGFFAYPWVFR